jgi:uncharacterized protein RhaS with RHS repeats
MRRRGRHYDPLAGQYVSADPIGLEGGSRVQGYVANPSASTDALGLRGIVSSAADSEAGGASRYAQWQNPDGTWQWPPNRGAIPGTTKDVILERGEVVDRYGYPGGTFVSPISVKYENRALMPGTHLKPYHKYVVQKQVPASQGTIAPWFGEPGGGTQYEFKEPIQKLLDDGYLKEVP